MSEAGKPAPSLEMIERLRNCVMGSELVERNAKEALVCYTGPDGAFYYETTNLTWAMGAVRRLRVSFDERERIETRRGVSQQQDEDQG